MLSKEETEKIETLLEHYPTRRAACLDALKVVQQNRGWVSDESIADLGRILGMTPGELDNIATFYNLIFRKPVGRHVILLCDSVSCYIMKYGDILEVLKGQLGIAFGETTDDRRFTLLPVPCLGACDQAPVMMVDEDLHTGLTAGKIPGILENYK
ncbi:MAG: NADH-quinone oxidoreductase subunit NuoE [Bacteroidetes bacterium]|nr:MAG: NADH-quinone oxidoreductase subunit NuoE [Bacteroidota bacterium]